jgi:hypothetical protein
MIDAPHASDDEIPLPDAILALVPDDERAAVREVWRHRWTRAQREHFAAAPGVEYVAAKLRLLAGGWDDFSPLNRRNGTLYRRVCIPLPVPLTDEDDIPAPVLALAPEHEWPRGPLGKREWMWVNVASEAATEGVAVLNVPDFVNGARVAFTINAEGIAEITGWLTHDAPPFTETQNEN